MAAQHQTTKPHLPSFRETICSWFVCSIGELLLLLLCKPPSIKSSPSGFFSCRHVIENAPANQLYTLKSNRHPSILFHPSIGCTIKSAPRLESRWTRRRRKNNSSLSTNGPPNKLFVYIHPGWMVLLFLVVVPVIISDRSFVGQPGTCKAPTPNIAWTEVVFCQFHRQHFSFVDWISFSPRVVARRIGTPGESPRILSLDRKGHVLKSFPVRPLNARLSQHSFIKPGASPAHSFDSLPAYLLHWERKISDETLLRIISGGFSSISAHFYFSRA